MAKDSGKGGFVEKVVPPGGIDAALDAWCSAILDCSPQAIRAQKAVMRGWEADERAAIAGSIDIFAESFRTGDPARHMAHLVSRR